MEVSAGNIASTTVATTTITIKNPLDMEESMYKNYSG